MKEETVINPRLSWRPDRTVSVESYPEAGKVLIRVRICKPDGSVSSETAIDLSDSEFEAVKKVSFASFLGFA